MCVGTRSCHHLWAASKAVDAVFKEKCRAATRAAEPAQTTDFYSNAVAAQSFHGLSSEEALILNSFGICSVLNKDIVSSLLNKIRSSLFIYFLSSLVLGPLRNFWNE